MWSKFRRTEEVIGFISDPMGPFINSTGLFTVSANGRNLTVNTMGAEASAVAYYYVPSFRMGEEIVVMAETFISCELGSALYRSFVSLVVKNKKVVPEHMP